MSLKETKEHLSSLLVDAENKVIALSGKWGSGKTYLLNEVMKEAGDESIKGALCVSLFGVSCIDQLKRKLIEAVVPGVESHPSIWKAAKQAVMSSLKVLGEFHPGFDALSDFNLLLMAPVMLREKVIVIDDIERKHENLGNDEILGFIDEYTQRHKSRFVLVLNSDKLAKRNDWDLLREKVIDQELKLLTTPEEAFSIAERLFPSRYSEPIKHASVTCELTNIRVIGKVIKAVNTILGDQQLEKALLARVIPSIVLFAAIHYRGLEDGPDFQFALRIGTPGDWRNLPKDKSKEPTEDERKQDKWRLLINELGIHECDEFEALVVEYLESGLFNLRKLTPIIDRYVTEKQNLEAAEQANQFIFKALWDHQLSDAQLLEIASKLPDIAGLLSPYLCSELEGILADISDGANIGQSIINNWIDAFKGGKSEFVADDNPFNRPLHNNIVAAFDSANTQVQAQTTVLDACMYIFDNAGWGTRQELAMKRATADDFESIIRSSEVEKLPRFMRRMIEMCLQKETYDPHFGAATDQFLEGCRNIFNDPSSRRLSKLIKRLFENTTLATELNLPQSMATHQNTGSVSVENNSNH